MLQSFVIQIEVSGAVFEIKTVSSSKFVLSSHVPPPPHTGAGASTLHGPAPRYFPYP